MMYCSVASDVNLKDYTLVLPSPSVGNVGQLAVDVLMASVDDIEHIGSLGHESVLPFASGDPLSPLSENGITSIEVYRSVKREIVLIQIRSSLISKQCEDEFASELVKWIVHHKFSKVVILTSAYGYQRLDCQIQDRRVRYVASFLAKESLGEQLSTLDCKELEPRETDATDSYPALQGQGFFHGASYAKCLFTKCVENNIPSVIFMLFSDDGDNTLEAIEVARICDGLVPMVSTDNEGKKLFLTPPEWKYAFGNDPPPGLY